MYNIYIYRQRVKNVKVDHIRYLHNPQHVIMYPCRMESHRKPYDPAVSDSTTRRLFPTNSGGVPQWRGLQACTGADSHHGGFPGPQDHQVMSAVAIYHSCSKSCIKHWKPRVVMMPILLALVAPKVVDLATCGTILFFQWITLHDWGLFTLMVVHP